MELKIYNPQNENFLTEIEWNFDELKAEISKKVEPYTQLVLTEDQIKDGKKDIANLRKLIKALESKRMDIKKQILIPYDKFEAKEKELVGVVQEAVDNIDAQLKAAEQKRRDEKLKKIKEIYAECIGDLVKAIPFEKAFKESYLNAGTTFKKIREEMTALYEKVETELRIINADMSPYVANMKQVYLETLDISKAMAKKNELEEAERLRKQDEERRKKAMEERARLLREQADMLERQKAEKQEPATAEPAPQAPEMPVIPSLTPEGNVIYHPAQNTSRDNLRRKRIVVSITANETQFEYLNKALAELRDNSEELKVLEKEDL